MSRSPKIALLVLGSPEAKTRHLGLVSHRGGGWYTIECMGEGKRCLAGTCTHAAGFGFQGRTGSVRSLRQIPRRMPEVGPADHVAAANHDIDQEGGER